MESKLPKIMKMKGVTIYDLIDMTGLSKQTITRARDERIRHCSLHTLESIAHALGVRTADLYENGLSPMSEQS